MKPNKEGVHLLTDKASSSKKVCQRFSEILAVNSRIDKHLENFIFGGQMGLKQLQQLPELPLKRFTFISRLTFHSYLCLCLCLCLCLSRFCFCFCFFT